VAVPVMALEHMLLFSIVEGIVTVLLFKYFAKHEPHLIYALTVNPVRNHAGISEE
jgi:cobalt/nickel transport system permease protein